MFKKIQDVLEVAVLIERGGIDFYNCLRDKLESPKARDVFSFLAAEEEKHAGTFRKMLEKKADYVPRYEYPGEYGKFLELMATVVIKKAAESLRSADILTDIQALEAGISMEKETILFYRELLDNPDLQDKDTLKNIIGEEKMHWQKLEALKGNIAF